MKSFRDQPRQRRNNEIFKVYFKMANIICRKIMKKTILHSTQLGHGGIDLYGTVFLIYA